MDYIRLFVVYNRECHEIKNRVASKHSEITAPLLSMYPMGKLYWSIPNQCQCMDEAIKFDTATHFSHIRSVFEIFDIDCDH